jgi:hypothetical protein
MIAMNFIEALIFIIGPAMFVLMIGFLGWVEKSDSPWAEKQRELNAELHARQQYFDDDDDDRNYQLEDQMLQYYRNKNFDRRQGRE